MLGGVSDDGHGAPAPLPRHPPPRPVISRLCWPDIRPVRNNAEVMRDRKRRWETTERFKAELISMLRVPMPCTHHPLTRDRTCVTSPAPSTGCTCARIASSARADCAMQRLLVLGQAERQGAGLLRHRVVLGPTILLPAGAQHRRQQGRPLATVGSGMQNNRTLWGTRETLRQTLQLVGRPLQPAHHAEKHQPVAKLS